MSNTTPENAPQFIDIDAIFKAKNKQAYNLTPRFLLSYIKNIVHQDEINEALRLNKDLQGLPFIDAILKQFGVKVFYEGLENIDADKRWLVASNHPLGGLDGMALMWVVGKVKKDIVFPVNDLLMNLSNIKELFIPINKHGSNSSNLKIIDDTFASDKGMIYFPAGLCSRKINGEIIDLEWKKTFISKCKKYNRAIIPCHVSGKNTNRFYNISNVRNRLKIKANLEMFFLVDEMFKQKGKEIVITFGKPIPPSTFDDKMSDLQWAEKLKQFTYNPDFNKESDFTALKF